MAMVRAGTAALAATFASLAGVTVLAIGIALVGSGRLDGVFLALLPLTAVACFEVIAPLSQAFALQDANEAAARRLSHAPAAASIASRGELTAMLVDEIGGIADLIVLDRASAHPPGARPDRKSVV